MREKNIYTLFLFGLGLLVLLYLIFSYKDIAFVQSLSVVLLIILLDLFPVRLLSGDEYTGGVIGFMILLLAFNVETALYGMYISTVLYFLKSVRWNPGKLAVFRMLSTIGMYTVCLFLTDLLIDVLGETPLFLVSGLGVLFFELINIFLIAGIYATVMGRNFNEQIHFKVKELLVPVLLCMTIIPHFTEELSNHLFFETFYTAMFLFIIISFSRAFLHQYLLRKKATEEFIRLVEIRQANSTHGHGVRSGTIAEQMLDKLSYGGKYKSELIMSAILHDIGKTKVSSGILKKRGALSLAEDEEYRSHSEKGAEIVMNITGNKKIADWIKYHHERYDGKGFPLGLKGKEIPYEARILSLCNELDHFIQGIGNDQYVLEKLQESSGKSLDPVLVNLVEVDDIAYIRSLLVFNNRQEETNESIDEYNGEIEGYLGGTILYKYSDGGFHPPVPNTDLLEDMIGLARRAIQTEQSLYERLKSEGRVYEVRFYPDNGTVLAVSTDITPSVRYRETMHTNILRSYKDVIETLSNSKIDICLSKEEWREQLGTFIASMQVNAKSDVALSRSFVAGYYPDKQDAKRLMHVKLAVSEGVTNLIKHACNGEVALYDRQGTLQICITDRGSGIPLHELPKTILVSGYSSKLSLGKGFALMHASADHVSLHTNSAGTSLLLEFRSVLSGQLNAPTS